MDHQLLYLNGPAVQGAQLTRRRLQSMPPTGGGSQEARGDKPADGEAKKGKKNETPCCECGFFFTIRDMLVPMRPQHVYTNPGTG